MFDKTVSLIVNLSAEIIRKPRGQQLSPTDGTNRPTKSCRIGWLGPTSATPTKIDDLDSRQELKLQWSTSCSWCGVLGPCWVEQPFKDSSSRIWPQTPRCATRCRNYASRLLRKRLELKKYLATFNLSPNVLGGFRRKGKVVCEGLSRPHVQAAAAWCDHKWQQKLNVSVRLNWIKCECVCTKRPDLICGHIGRRYSNRLIKMNAPCIAGNGGS